VIRTIVFNRFRTSRNWVTCANGLRGMSTRCCGRSARVRSATCTRRYQRYSSRSRGANYRYGFPASLTTGSQGIPVSAYWG
jgi:hypothetical protein